MTKLGVLDVEGTKYTLKLGETYLVGYKSNDYAHDIEIDDTSVDIKHCILDFTERSPKVFDIRSKCGTFVDGILVAGCQMIPLVKSTTIQFGKVEATLQLTNEGDSGYLEGRLTPPTKNDSEIICNSPENVASSGSRLKHVFKSSTLTSTPNAATTTNNCTQNATKSTPQFLVPTGVPRKSTGSNTSARSVDSFYIPETQYPVENGGDVSNSNKTSFDINKSKDKSVNVEENDDDFFIPETQEVIGTAGKLSNYPRVAFANENINETVEDEAKIPSSQFRICTQDFNGSDDDLSNNSDDLLANVPCSLVIPAIRHDPVQIDDLLNGNNDEEEIDKEMSALQWSKRTDNGGDDCVTPDNLIPADGAVTPDLIQGKEGCVKETVCDSVADPQPPAEHVPDDRIESSLKENDPPPDIDFQPTQVFIRPPSMSKSFTKPSTPQRNEKSVGPQGDDSLFLPATQVFTSLPKRNSSSAALPPPPAAQVSSTIDDDDLPPTQVFQIGVTVPKNLGLSSTLIESGMQLSESSFKAKCNKLLDSDDDEMDEVIAPELVKQMREFLEKPKKSNETLPAPVTETTVQTPVLEKSSKVKESSSKSTDTTAVTPKDKFLVPTKAAKKNSHLQPAVSIDTFLFTPDFLGKEFSKDEQLQKLAEVNWKNIISEKQGKSLFGDEDSDGNPINSESDDSQDSFNDLLPHKEPKTKKLEPEKSVEKVNKSTKPKEPVEEPAVRITRRRKSTFPEETKARKVPRKTSSDPNVQPKTESKAKNEVKPKEIQKNVKPTAENNDKKAPKAEKSKKSNEKNFVSQGRERVKLRRITVSAESEKKDKVENTPQHTVTETTRRTTRQSPKMSEYNANQASTSLHQNESKNLSNNLTNSSKSRHHNESKDLLQTRSNRSKDTIDSRYGIKQKESEKKTENAEEKNKKQLKDSGKDAMKSSTKRAKSSEEEIKDKKKKRDNKSKELARIESDEMPLPRLTRLRSGKTESAVVLSNERNVADRRKETDLSSKGSDDEDSTPNQSNTSDSTRSAPNAATSSTATTTGKRKNEVDKSKIKRQRNASSTDSGKSLRMTPVAKVKIAITMCDPRYQDVLERHSGSLWLYTKDPKECDVMVVERGNRTYKLMVAIARGIPVVKLDWLVEVLRKKSMDVPYERFIFDDKQFQERHQFVMKNSLNLAKTKSLFSGISFMVTPGIRPVPDEMKDIITCAGGTVLENVPRSQNNQRLYLVSQPKDNQHWHRYCRLNSNIKIVTSEGVMASVMQQSEGPLIKSVIQ